MPCARQRLTFSEMKVLLPILLLVSMNSLAQKAGTYAHLLGRTREIVIIDSIQVEAGNVDYVSLDTPTLKNFFQMIYPPILTNKSGPPEYYISGKITTHPNFDLLLVTTKKGTVEESVSESVYLLANRKDGSNINMLTVSIRRENKDATVIAHSSISRDLKVLVTTKINSKGKYFSGLSEYRLTEDGRFMHYPHYNK